MGSNGPAATMTKEYQEATNEYLKVCNKHFLMNGFEKRRLRKKLAWTSVGIFQASIVQWLKGPEHDWKTGGKPLAIQTKANISPL
jgi:hypothetical protein